MALPRDLQDYYAFAPDVLGFPAASPFRRSGETACCRRALRARMWTCTASCGAWSTPRCRSRIVRSFVDSASMRSRVRAGKWGDA